MWPHKFDCASSKNHPSRLSPLGLLQLIALILALLASHPASASASNPRDFDLPGTNRPVPVEASFHLVDLLEIDDEAESFEFSGILTLRWKDEDLKFDPAVEGVTEKLFHGAFQWNELSPSWYPQVILANASQLPEFQAILARVTPDGTCTLIQDLHAVARNELKLRLFPFDHQRLEAVFEVLGFDITQVALKGTPASVTADISTIRVPQWHLDSVSVDFRDKNAPYLSPGAKASSFTLSLNVHRQSFFVVRLVIIPLLIVVILSWCVFWMDRSSLADRMSVSFVGILTAVAYQAMLGDIMPHISYITFINAFISLSFLIMSATAIVNLKVCIYDRNGNHELGDLIDHRCKWIFPLAYLAIIAIAFIFSYLTH
jgi:hypothetical protein